MTERREGHFVVGELPDGRFIAASSSAPFFCFRAESEEALIKKVRRALGFYRDHRSEGARVKSVSQTVTTVQPTKRVALNEVLCEAA